MGAFAWLALLLASVVSIKNGTALSYGGPILLGLPTGCHFLIVVQVISGLDDERERRQCQ